MSSFGARARVHDVSRRHHFRPPVSIAICETAASSPLPPLPTPPPIRSLRGLSSLAPPHARPRPAPPGSPLFIRLGAFSTSDGDALKGAAFRAWARRALRAEFSDGSVSAAFVTNATTPGAYYARLGAAALAFDSLPFAACNTLQDVLALRVPLVSAAHDGEFEPGSASPLRWRSAIGAAMLTRVGLSG